MKPPVPLLAMVVLSSLVAMGAACTSAAVPSDPMLARGQAVYLQNCASCHGDNGEGKVAPPLINISKRYPNVSKEIAVIADGRSTMPGWKGKLSADEIAAVAAYSRTL